MIIKVTLPYPVSSNRAWRNPKVPGRGRASLLSKKARSYKQAVGQILLTLGIKEPMDGLVAVSYQLFPKLPKDWQRLQRKDPGGWAKSVRCIDLTNADKLILDAMQGIVYLNDKQVWSVNGTRMVPDGEARIELMIGPHSLEKIEDAHIT